MGAVGDNPEDKTDDLDQGGGYDECGEKWLDLGYILKPTEFAGILAWEGKLLGNQEWPQGFWAN